MNFMVQRLVGDLAFKSKTKTRIPMRAARSSIDASEAELCLNVARVLTNTSALPVTLNIALQKAVPKKLKPLQTHDC